MSRECNACESIIHPDDMAYELPFKEPDYPDYLCERCYEKALIEYESIQAAAEDYGMAKIRGEL